MAQIKILKLCQIDVIVLHFRLELFIKSTCKQLQMLELTQLRFSTVEQVTKSPESYMVTR